MTKRSHNFCAGPAALPTDVLQKAQAEMLNWQGRGVSVMEVSHRHAAFMELAQQAESHLRKLLNIPDNYRVIFMQGGATAQFSLVPLNLLGDKKQADYIDTGIWSAKAIKQMQAYGHARICGPSVQVYQQVQDCQQVQSHQQAQGCYKVPAQHDLDLDPHSAYVHYCPNETISGLAFDYIPDTGDTPLVADMSSVILSAPLDVSRFGVIYAGAQKNIGPAGITLIIVREDLLGHARADTPGVFNYQLQADNDSMLNTPPTYAWYLASLVFEWLLANGGLTAMQATNQAKADCLYQAIDGSGFYTNQIAKPNRSIMNVTFSLADQKLDAVFLQQAEQHGLLNLKGHRIIGGMRASIYNAVPLDSVKALVAFMADFEKQHG